MAPVVETTSVFQDLTLLSVLCSLQHHRGITASIFQVNELVLEDDETLGQKDRSLIWEGFNGIWPITAMQKQTAECKKAEQNGAAYKLQAAEMGFTAVTEQTWRCEAVTEDWREFSGLDITGDGRDSNTEEWAKLEMYETVTDSWKVFTGLDKPGDMRH